LDAKARAWSSGSIASTVPNCCSIAMLEPVPQPTSRIRNGPAFGRQRSSNAVRILRRPTNHQWSRSISAIRS